jgi:hypothetical protein
VLGEEVVEGGAIGEGCHGSGLGGREGSGGIAPAYRSFEVMALGEGSGQSGGEGISAGDAVYGIYWKGWGEEGFGGCGGEAALGPEFDDHGFDALGLEFGGGKAGGGFVGDGEFD